MSKRIDRRQCLRKGAAGVFAGAALVAGASGLPAAEESPKPVRIAVIGLGGRGSYLLRCLLSHHPGVSVPALCELQPDRLEAGIAMVKKIKGTTPVGYCKGEFEYRNMLERDDVDGVLVATGVQKFGRIATDVMKAGKHVGTEVTGPHTLEDCWAIVEEHERSGKHYMLLEQCCYGDVNLMILNMVKQGLFGETYYATCSYVHDVKTGGSGKSRLVNSDQTLSWRGRLVAEGRGSSYPAHGIAPVAKWLGINDGDRFEHCIAMMSDPREIHAQVVEQFGPDSEAAKIKFHTGDFHTTLIKTAKGKMIRLDYSLSNTRPYSRYYLLQGMNGCYDSRTGLFLKGASSERHPGYGAWDPVEEFFEKYRHPFWRKDEKTALATGGHGGMDYFCIRDFVAMCRHGQAPWSDCYDAAAWNALNHCSEQSIDRQGAPVEIPDFTKGKWKDPNWRKDRPSPASVIPT
ncbi:MAG: Gfo/Idh/MocA family oxidoreductase [Planctomycetes bacterium]|nr:Gfo/Idh/MocA family oxidoreductase [Planctomycetota bacterium]MBL7037831.1 Gfo/Idh/MocA family oxidoreductase [Pirellulaceae bacterium]